MSQTATLLATVVEGGYCIGCGACAAVPGSPLRIAFDGAGRLQAERDPAAPPDADAPVLDVCPFSGHGPDEDAIAGARFADHAGAAHDGRVGFHLRTWAGHVATGGDRARGSSGGLTSWLLVRLLETDAVDAVVHVRPDGRTPGEDGVRLFDYTISGDPDAVRAGAKSRYYPVELSSALARLQSEPGRYAVVGVPCFVKAVHRLAAQEPVVAERVRYTVALVCGHLKSARFAEDLAWQAGFAPGTLTEADFRHKLPDRPASRYAARLAGRRIADGAAEEVVLPMSEAEGGDWGQGAFKHRACDFCDDVLGETADVTFGDAWLPGYVEDPAGTNVVVARDPALATLLEAGANAGELVLEPIGADRVAASQDAGLRHRRDGLAYRLWRADAVGRWRPAKRVAPSRDHLRPRQRRIFELRVALMEESHRAFAAALALGDRSVYSERMRPLIAAYEKAYALKGWRRTASLAKRRALAAVRR